MLTGQITAVHCENGQNNLYLILMRHNLKNNILNRLAHYFNYYEAFGPFSSEYLFVFDIRNK